MCDGRASQRARLRAGLVELRAQRLEEGAGSGVAGEVVVLERIALVIVELLVVAIRCIRRKESLEQNMGSTR